jgi:5-methylcytosine-specific restriction protein A
LSRAASTSAETYTSSGGGTTELQRQGGILTPREVPIIIVVTGEEGREFGYEDYWDGEGVFHYFGAGQEGDMEFACGNLALRDHAQNGEESISSSKSVKASVLRADGRRRLELAGRRPRRYSQPASCDRV